MPTYRFTLHVVGNVEASLDALYEAGWADAGVSGDHESGSAEFVRDAPDAIEALTSAIEQGEACGLVVTAVSEDLVTLDEVAERTDRTLAAVEHWVRGRRGPGDFPTARLPRRRGALYSWAAIADWLSANDLAAVDPADVEVAKACALLDAVLRARNGLRSLPDRSRRRLTHLVG